VITDWVEDRSGKEILEGFQCHHFVPFDPVSKRTEAVVEWMAPNDGTEMFSFQVKGRPFRVRRIIIVRLDFKFQHDFEFHPETSIFLLSRSLRVLLKWPWRCAGIDTLLEKK
jgi:hypothetical protein